MKKGNKAILLTAYQRLALHAIALVEENPDLQTPGTYLDDPINGVVSALGLRKWDEASTKLRDLIKQGTV